jgi:hypothetical protein
MIARHQQYLSHVNIIKQQRAGLPGPSFYVGRDPGSGFRYWAGVSGEITIKRFTGDYAPAVGTDLQREVIGR